MTVGYASNRDSAHEVVAEQTDDGGSVSVHRGNIGNPEDWIRAVGKVLEAEGGVGLTRSPILETAGKGFPVDCVAQGFTMTHMVPGMREGILETIRERIPMRGHGITDAIAPAAQFLLAQRSSYINGAGIPANSGLDTWKGGARGGSYGTGRWHSFQSLRCRYNT